MAIFSPRLFISCKRWVVTLRSGALCMDMVAISATKNSNLAHCCPVAYPCVCRCTLTLKMPHPGILSACTPRCRCKPTAYRRFGGPLCRSGTMWPRWVTKGRCAPCAATHRAILRLFGQKRPIPSGWAWWCHSARQVCRRVWR